MKISTRSKRIRTSIDFVLRKLPPKERTIILELTYEVVCLSEWNGYGMEEDTIDSRAAYTLETPRDLSNQDRSNDINMVKFNLPVCRLFSEAALRGIIAHEFAHIRRASVLGPGWCEKMERNYYAEEKKADAIAKRWGFSREIMLKDRERKNVVNPIIIETRTPQINRLIAKRLKRLERYALKIRQSLKR